MNSLDSIYRLWQRQASGRRVTLEAERVQLQSIDIPVRLREIEAELAELHKLDGELQDKRAALEVPSDDIKPTGENRESAPPAR